MAPVSKYPTKQLDFLRTNYATMLLPELTASFNAKFGLDKKEGAIKSTLKNHKITCGRKTGKTKGRYKVLTPPQAQFVRDNYTILSQSELTVALNSEFGIKITVRQIRTFTKNHRIRSGRTGCYEKGHEPSNKGTKGLMKPNFGSFKPGQAPPNRKPVGAERISSHDGYISIKVNESDPYTGFPTRYRMKHVVIWEKEHGPVPNGMIANPATSC
jgi:hypothetical protein